MHDLHESNMIFYDRVISFGRAISCRLLCCLPPWTTCTRRRTPAQGQWQMLSRFLPASPTALTAFPSDLSPLYPLPLSPSQRFDGCGWQVE